MKPTNNENTTDSPARSGLADASCSAYMWQLRGIISKYGKKKKVEVEARDFSQIRLQELHSELHAITNPYQAPEMAIEDWNNKSPDNPWIHEGQNA